MRVPPVHEQHLVQREPVRLHCLAHDAERRLVPRGEVSFKLDNLAHVPGGVEHHLRVHFNARQSVRLARVTAFERDDRAIALVSNVLHRARPELHAALDAPREQFVFEFNAIHLRVRPVELDALRALVVDHHARLGPDVREAVVQAQLLELVHPDAVVVAPRRERARVHQRHAEALLAGAICRGQTRGAAPHDEQIHAVLTARGRQARQVVLVGLVLHRLHRRGGLGVRHRADGVAAPPGNCRVSARRGVKRKTRARAEFAARAGRSEAGAGQSPRTRGARGDPRDARVDPRGRERRHGDAPRRYPDTDIRISANA
mmetsp:Transcript_7944/g.33200  ORF Transcript_7944/g.33200 Transcript_7944/m.33200 type:complete len:316 (+) Transcript_7944:6184-7131(+)